MSGYLQKKTNYPYFKSFLTSGTYTPADGVGVSTTNGISFTRIDIISNTNDYNTTTCAYTVPISGLYRFNVTMSCNNTNGPTDDSMHVGFNINNGTRYYGRVDNPEYFAESGKQYLINYTIIILLNKNDTVKVFFFNNVRTQEYYDTSFFEGYLITSFSA